MYVLPRLARARGKPAKANQTLTRSLQAHKYMVKLRREGRMAELHMFKRGDSRDDSIFGKRED